MKPGTVAHITSVHSRADTRIFQKECLSLLSAGYRVCLIVADGLGDATVDGISVYDVGKQQGRLRRILTTTRRIRDSAIKVDADVYHLHDPELLLIAGALRRTGKVVIFDAHEDVPLQILGKPYAHPLVRRLLSSVYARFESWECRRLSAVIAATPYIRDKFLRMNTNCEDVNNYPIPGELVTASDCTSARSNQVCYVGGLGRNRGIFDVVQSMELAGSGTRLALCGKYENDQLESELQGFPGWSRVDYYGWLDREGVCKVFSESLAGLVTLHPLPNYLDSHPIKMFEYMSAGLPVIASDFPLWRGIIVENDCGICVNPLDPKSIAEAIDYLVENPGRAREMGENGRRLVQCKYNWPTEAKKLTSLYARLLMRNDN